MSSLQYPEALQSLEVPAKRRAEAASKAVAATAAKQAAVEQAAGRLDTNLMSGGRV